MSLSSRVTLGAASLLLSFGTAGAGAAEDPPVSRKGDEPSIEQAVVGDPFETGPIDTAIPPVDATGFIPESPAFLVSPYIAHEGRFTWGLDMPLQPLNLFSTTNEGTWKLLFDPAPAILEHTASPQLPVYMHGILDEAHAHQSEFKTVSTNLDDALQAFADLLGPSVTFTPSSGPPSFFGYRPLRARWLRSQWKGPELIPLPETQFVYPDYAAFRDIRQRGARLYCAARRGQREQDEAVQLGLDATSLGRRSAFSFSLLGQTIDLLSLTSTVVFNGPQRCTGGALDAPSCLGSGGAAPSDGAQAFEVPLLLGHRLTPIRGLGLPGFAEIQVPLVLVSGDSEVQTATDKRPVLVGYQFVCPPCLLEPQYQVLHSKTYRTVTHTDAVLSGSRGYHLTGNFPFFFLGPVEVSFGLDFSYSFGDLTNPLDRVIQPQGLLATWPPPTRTGWLFANPASGGWRYHEGPWRLRPRPGAPGALYEWRILPHGETIPYWREPLFPLLLPHDIQALTDDDHSLASRTHVQLGGTISGTLGGDIGPFETTLTVSGGLTATLDHDHVVRDALMAQAPPPPVGPVSPPPMRPITALSVRARAQSSLDFTGLSARIHFKLSIPFFDDIEFDESLFSVPGIPLASPQDTDDELDPTLPNDDALALRLGTGSKLGQPMLKPAVLSHLPQASDFETFEDDVPTCLADPAPNPDPVDPCPGEEPQGTPPHAHVCLYGPSGIVRPIVLQIPMGVCSNIPGYLNTLGLLGEQRACVGRYLAFLCTPTTQTQPFKGEIVVSRLWDFDLAMKDDLKTIIDQCVAAFIPSGTPGAQGQAEQFVKGLVSPAVCTDQAKNLTNSEVFAFLPASAPVATPAPACAN